MRVTSGMYYKSIQERSSSANQKLFDVNKQISSGLKIQYAKDDVRTFTETMRLDNEMVTLGQIKKSTESGYKVSNQADTVLNEFQTNMNRTRVLLLQAANDGAHSDSSMDAIAKELRGIESQFKNLANTSVNGQFIFSGSAVDIKPISDDGKYMGNDGSMGAFVGSGVQQKYNLSGAELFLGEEFLVKREVTSNVVQNINNPSSNDVSIDSSLTMREFMGDSPSDKHYFYLRGVKHDGSAFNKQIEMTDDETIGVLLDKIGKAYGNTNKTKLVNVSMNSNGHITIEDKMHGSSKLDFHLVGATDFSNSGRANVTNIDALDSGTTDYDAAVAGAGDLYIKEFVKSPFASASATITNNDSLLYDRTMFSISGNTISSNVPQINKETNAFATPSTKISEVADTTNGLDGVNLMLKGKDIAGNDYSVRIELKDSGSQFSLDTDGDGNFDNGTYDIFNMADPRVATPANDVTYQQFMDVINMTVTNNIPAANTASEYDSKIEASNTQGTTTLSYDGKIEFGDLSSAPTKATMSLYDSNSGDFTANASVMTFNANDALKVRDPKTDFFKNLDEMITAVENHKTYPDASKGDIRNVGVENAIAMLDDLMDHVGRSHSTVGAQSNSLNSSLERTQTLEISTMTLRSSVIDTDLAEASLNLTQLMTNYQAMLSSVGKISKLSLVNYL